MGCTVLLASVALLRPGSAAAEDAGARNLIVNPDFACSAPAEKSSGPGRHRLAGYEGEAFLPLGWEVEPSGDGAGVLSMADEDGHATLRIRTKRGERVRLRQCVEVVPEAAYTCAVSVKGRGPVALRSFAYVPATNQDFGAKDGTASDAWTKLSLPAKVGLHRHVLVLMIDVHDDADVMLRGAEVTAPFATGSLPEALVTSKPDSDESTLYYEGFDGPSYSFALGKDCELTGRDEGRFGRGLLVKPVSGGAKARLSFGKLPETGTIEFWYRPETKLPDDGNPNSYVCPFVLTTPVAYRQLVVMLNSWATSVIFGFQTQQWDCRPSWAGTWLLGNRGRANWRPGSWHHVAGSWDMEATRLYVDGALQGIRILGGEPTEWTCRAKDIQRPEGEALELVLTTACTVDEIRVSNSVRYGPLVPAGAARSPLVVERPEPAPAAAGNAYLETPEKDLDAIRTKALASVPDPGADYVFGIDRARPAWEGMGGMKVEKDYFGPGADGLALDVNREWNQPRTIFWKLDGIRPGRYYVGLWQEMQRRQWDWQATDPRIFEYDPERLLTCAYLNGYPVRFRSTSDPVRVGPGVWLGELQTDGAVDLKPGDEIAVRGINANCVFLRLALYRDEPRRGHGVTGQTFGRTFSCSRPFPQLRLSVRAGISGPGEAGAAHEATIRIANPLPYAADAVVDWKLADYFGAPVAGTAEPVRIEPHASAEIRHKFVAEGGARAYQLDVTTRAAAGSRPPVARPREMLELNDWARLEFLPNLAGPMDVRVHERIDLRFCSTGGRRSLLLDGGGWERAPMLERRVPASPPADLKYGGVNVPYGNWWPPKGQFGAWFRKRFRVPEWLRGETFQLEIGRAYREGTAFLNGRRLEGVCRGCIPSRQDVTGLLELDGENELVVLVRGDVALVTEDYVDLYNPDAWIENDAHRDFPPTNENMGRALSSVWLRALPAVRVRQTLVVPDVERNELLVFSRVENLRDAPCTVELRYAFSQEGKDVPSSMVPPRKVTIGPGKVLEVKAVGTGRGLEAYTSSRPVLTKLRTSVVEDGAVVDAEEIRFGYRSVTVKGGELALNGRPLTFLGTGPNVCPLPGREDGTTIARLVQVTTLDAMDEVGIFHYPPVSSSWPASEWTLLNNERYWRRDREQGVELIWRYATRPSCVGWDLSNENYHYACYAVGGEGQAKLGERLFSVAQEVRRRIWPGFWFLSDGNESLGNRLEFTSWHYMNNGGWSSGYHGHYGFNEGAYRGVTGTSCYAPDSFYLCGAANPPAADAVVKPNCVPDTWKPGMACAATEEYWFTDQHNGPAIAKYVGDDAAVSTACQFSTPRGMWWTKLSVEGYRDMGASVMGVYALNFIGLAMQGVTFSVPEHEIRCYSGSDFSKRLTVFDSEYAPGDLEFTWRLVAPGGRARQRGAFRIRSGISTIERRGISFRAPRVAGATRFTLDMELRKDGKLREHEERIVEVHPPAGRARRASVPTEPVALFDPAGRTRAALERFGCRTRIIAMIDAPNLAGSRCLIIGEGAVREGMKAEREALMRFAESGGRVLVMPQTDGSIMPTGTYFEKRNYSSMGFVRAAEHPVVKGLEDMDFAMWNPGHLIARGLYRVPTSGNCLPLVECYHLDRDAKAISWSPLLELYVGEGSVLATQLPIVENLETEPMAAEVLRRVLAYLSREVYRRPRARLAVLDGVSEPVLKRLREIRADFEIVGGVSAEHPATLVEMNRPEFGAGASADAFGRYVRNGGTLVLHRARPEHEAWLEALTGRDVGVGVQPYRSWIDRAMLERRAGLAEGLSNVDLYWRPGVGGEGSESTLQVSGTVAEGKGQVEYVVKVDGAPDCLFPGGLVEVPLGKGRIVIDQIKWELPEREKNDYGSPSRVASAMLGNLGVVMKPVTPKPELPKGVRYEPVDIGAVANRGIRDEKAGDDVGWVDWGPGQEINDFPVGENSFGGVPFRTPRGDRNAIVLRANPGYVKSLAGYPESVTVPVNKARVAGFWFLSTGGWTRGAKPYGWRRIVYADGSRETMALNETNFADWNYGHDQFPTEEGSSTHVAWKGSCRANAITRAYMTLWLNPHPEREVKEIVLTNAGLAENEGRFIAHLAVTAAILADAATAAPARDPGRSQALLREALALKEAKRNAEASAKLEESLKADDQNVSAWTALAEIHAAADGVEQFTALCRRWFDAMPRNYQARNVLGHFLEEKGRFAEALAQYRKSLEIEWNQPPAIQAVERLERKLGIRK